MKIHLISPRLSIHKGDLLGSGVPYWPLEMAVFAGFLRKVGIEPSVTDLFGLSPQTLSEDGDLYWQGLNIQNASNLSTDDDLFIIFAISFMSLLEIENIVLYLKKHFKSSKIAILENSQAVTAFDLDVESQRLFDAGADFLILGEPYFNWPQIYGFINDKNIIPENIKTPLKPSKIKRIYNKQSSYVTPAWDLFPYQNYWNLPYSHGPKIFKRHFPILTSRGCPYPCDFCVIPQNNDRLWRGRSPQNIVDEIIELRDKFGVTHFDIEDLNPTVNWRRFSAFCEELLIRKANISFSIVSGTKAETVDLESIALLADAGCRYLSISPESGSASLMNIIGKPFDYDYALKLVELCSKHKIRTQACFLVGHPSENDLDFKASCKYLRRLVQTGLDEVAIFVVSPFSGSRLHREDRIRVKGKNKNPTFGPKGRVDQDLFSERRSIMIKLFFHEKLKKGWEIWFQGLRALFFHPETKMENLPKRVAFVIKGVLRVKLKIFFPKKAV